jgi:hypothetical protein
VLSQAELIEARIMAGELAQHDLIQFATLTQPEHSDRANPFQSHYHWGIHHRYIADALERVARGEIMRLEIEMPPRHAKSELAIRQYASWMAGRCPDRSGIILTHTDELAQAHGRDVRDYIQSAGYRTVFGHRPESQLRTDSRAADRLQMAGGGVLTFSGSAGLGAGVGGDWLLVDDLFKNSEEAASPTSRDAKWRAYNVDCKSRLNEQTCPIVMVGSRRNEDDVQGRIFDPTNPHYDAQEADRWVRIRLPALSEGEDVDPLKRPLDAPLWPERFNQAFFFEKRNSASDIIRDDFQTQYQCKPRPEEGTWFKKGWLKTYLRANLPKHLRIYVASDHAVRIKEKNDKSCLLVVGIDPAGDIYILPETVWEKLLPDALINAMFKIAKSRQLSCWWAARDAISGALEPFIRMRMRAENCYFVLDDSITESKDLVQRSSSIRGLMAMGKVHWPSEWSQWLEAQNQLLSFPGKHDDLVAALAVLGMGMDRMVKAEGPKPQNLPARGSFEWHNFGQDKPKDNNIWA